MLSVSAVSSASFWRLWQVCSDVRRWPEYLENFTAVDPLDDDGRIGVGSRFAVTQPRLAAATYEVTAWQPGEGFTWVSRAPGVCTTATHRVTATATGSQIDLGIEWTGSLAWLVRLLLSRSSRRMIQSEATTFARIAETRTSADDE